MENFSVSKFLRESNFSDWNTSAKTTIDTIVDLIVKPKNKLQRASEILKMAIFQFHVKSELQKNCVANTTATFVRIGMPKFY